MTRFTGRLGTIDWVDLSTTDVDGARGFYSAVLSWTYQSSTTPMGSYHVAFAGQHQAAGMMSSDPDAPAPPSWSLFVRVSDVHEAVVACTDAGGSVLAEPFEIPGGARVAVIADPAGAVLAVISGGPEPAEDEPLLRRHEHGAVGWCELLSRDPHASVSFYDAVFGWTAVRDPTTGYSVFHLGAVEIAGLLPMPGEVPPEVPSCWQVYFEVTDVDAAVTSALAAGGVVAKAPTSVGPMRFAVLSDPAGATFCVITTPAP